MAKKKPKAPASAVTVETAAIIGFKAFESAWTCKGFQYEIGKSYEHAGPVRLCESGFHACTVPFDCWNYHSGSMIFARVTARDPVFAPDTEDRDSKFVT